VIPRHVETVFCDDIRQEVGGKLSLIGVYSGGLLVSAFPVTLPKLCLFVRVVTPGEEPLRSLKLRVMKDDDVLQEIVMDEEQLAAASDSTEDTTEEQSKGRVRLAHFLLVFSPIQFVEPCSLRVRIQTEHGELAGVGLKVEQMQAPAMLTPDQATL
jgi:hypothetical protein